MKVEAILFWGPVVWLTALNAVAFCAMGVDKSKARRGRWRIPEKLLFLLALLGGSLGAWAGMYCFHHKTKRWYFVIGMPLILAAQLAAGYYFYYGFF